MRGTDILFVVALKEETADKFNNLDLIYTGIGKVNAAYVLTKELIKRKFENRMPKYVVNFGSCGSKKFKKGDLVACNRFIQRDMDSTIFNYKLGETPQDKDIPMIIEHKKILEDLPYGVCGTGDNFALGECPIKEVDLVEMEAYSLAKICYLENIDFISIKYITDGLDENGANDWNKEVQNAPESFYNYIYSKLLK